MRKWINKIKTTRGIRALFLIYYKSFHKYKKLADILYLIQFGHPINWEKPEDLNQWINWLEFNSDTSMWSLLADKYTVRSHLKNLGLDQFLIPLLAVWDNPSEIDFSSLPESFVIKMNNGSGDVKVILDKNKEDLESIKKYFKKVFYKNFALVCGEPHYSKIPPKIIVEKLLDKRQQSIPSSSLIDYKIWCINGNPECIRVYYNRTKDSVVIDTYDTNWVRHPEYNNIGNGFIQSNIELPKPVNLYKMLEIASILSKNMPQVRVDLYETDSKIYFGELTFSSHAGKMTSFSDFYLKKLGEKIDLGF